MKIARPFLHVVAVCGILAMTGCGGGESTPGGNTAYLNVSVSDFYFGTRDVGTTATQTIELANWSGDVYPIHNLTINGQNPEEFETNFAGGVTLNPSEKISVDLSFSPLSDGLKAAVLDIDYDIVEQVTDQQNVVEQDYYAARALETQQHYVAALGKYQSYVNADPATVNEKRAAIKLPVLAEGDLYGTGQDFNQYLTALNNRENGEPASAIRVLDNLVSQAPGSYLEDDALYLKGYIQLIDQQNHADAIDSMVTLIKRFPDSTYYDTALYSIALSLEETGETQAAAEKYKELVMRHRSENWAVLNLNLPKDNFVSRMWFNRANLGLDRING